MFEPDPGRTGLLIRQQRNLAKITQKKLAEELGVTDKAVSKWETGDGLPDIALLPRLAARLGLTTDELLAGRQLDADELEKTKPGSLLAFGLAAYLFLEQLAKGLSTWLARNFLVKEPGGPADFAAFILFLLSCLYFYGLASWASLQLTGRDKVKKDIYISSWILLVAGFLLSLFSVMQNISSLQLVRTSYFWLGLAVFFQTAMKRPRPGRIFAGITFLALAGEFILQLLVLLSSQAAIGLKVTLLSLVLHSLVLLVFWALAWAGHNDWEKASPC